MWNVSYLVVDFELCSLLQYLTPTLALQSLLIGYSLDSSGSLLAIYEIFKSTLTFYI
jgi:hypothetical protein